DCCLLRSRERIPCRHGFIVDGDGDRISPCYLASDESMEGHAEVQLELFRERFKSRLRASSPWNLVSEDPVQRFPHHDRAVPAMQGLKKPLIAVAGRKDKYLPAVALTYVIEVKLTNFDSFSR